MLEREREDTICYIQRVCKRTYGSVITSNKYHQEFDTIQFFRGSTSKFGKLNALHYHFLHHSEWKVINTNGNFNLNKGKKDRITNKIFFSGKTKTLGNVYDAIAILIPVVGIGKLKENNNIIKAFIYSIDLLRIKSILINGAFVNANIGDEVYFNIYSDEDHQKKKIHNVLRLCLVYGNHRTEKNMKHTKCHSIKYILDLNWNIYKFQLWEKIQDNTNNINFLSIHVSITYSSSLKTSKNNVDNNENSNMLFLLDDFGVQFDDRKKLQQEECHCFEGIKYEKKHVCSTQQRHAEKKNVHYQGGLRNAIKESALWLRKFV